jgi:hypothetical protein
MSKRSKASKRREMNRNRGREIDSRIEKMIETEMKKTGYKSRLPEILESYGLTIEERIKIKNSFDIFMKSTESLFLSLKNITEDDFMNKSEIILKKLFESIMSIIDDVDIANDIFNGITSDFTEYLSSVTPLMERLAKTI